MPGSDKSRDKADASHAPGHAAVPKEQPGANPDHDRDGDDLLDDPHVKTEHLYDLMPDENGEFEGRPIPTGV